METSKTIWKSKTFWLNAVGIIITLLESGDVVDMLPVEYQAMIPAALGTLNIIVRFKTTQPVTLGLPK